LVDTRNGAIEVDGDLAARQADIRGSKFGNGATPEAAKAYAEQIQIEVKRDPAQPGLLRIAAVFPQPDNGGASFCVTLPPTAALDLQTRNGTVAVDGPFPDVAAHTSNGHVDVTGVTGKVNARTRNGGITIRQTHGDVDADTSNGGITLEKVGAEHVNARSTNGAVQAFDTRGNIVLRTSNGPIHLRAASLPEKPDVSVTTSNGRVVVELPATVSARLRMRTSNGSVHADFPGAAATDLETSRDDLAVTLNQGGGSVVIESSNGALRLRLVPAQTP